MSMNMHEDMMTSPPHTTPLSPQKCEDGTAASESDLCFASSASSVCSGNDDDETVTILESFARDGFVCLSQVIDARGRILDEWRTFCHSYFIQCFEILYQQGHTPFPMHCRKDGSEYAMKCGSKHGFRELVMRSPGRYELSLLHHYNNTNGSSCSFPSTGAGVGFGGVTGAGIGPKPPSLEPILEALAPIVPPLLQESSLDQLCLCHVSLLVATSGATEQAWHADGCHVSVSTHLPCHVLNVFIPLVDLSPDFGPTMLRPGTHVHTRNLAPLLLLAKARKTLRTPVVPCIKAGDVLIFDYRILHRGCANRNPNVHRPILVLTWAKNWFVDVCNFPKRSMYEPSTSSDN